MKEEQHRLRSIFALDKHPLFHAVDVDSNFFGDAGRQGTSVFVYEGNRFSGAP
jgi:hypothetical protein